MPKRLRRDIQAGVAILALGLSGTTALACAFHTYTPEPTVIDILMQADRIAFARPAPDGGLRIVDAVLGEAPGAPIPVTLPDTTRDRLAADPQQTVLLARSADYGPWEMVADASPGFQAAVVSVVPYLSTWALGDDITRYQVFADLLGHPDPSVRRLALLELDRADYSLLRGLNFSLSAPPPDLAESDPALRPISVLLAGLTGQTGTAADLADVLQQEIGSDLPFLGAYVIALLEQRGAEAAEQMATDYLRDTAMAIGEREKVLEGFAIMARAGAPDLAEMLRAITADVLTDAPELGPAVARQFGFQGDWSQGDALMDVLKSHDFADIADVFALNQYIALAQQSGN